MSVIEYRIKPQGRVLSAYASCYSRVAFIMGPLGSGKTIQSCINVFKHMCEQEANAEEVRPSRWYAIRNTYPDLFGTTIKDWLSMYGDLGPFRPGSKEPPTQKLKFELADGTIVEAEMIFLALDREEHVKKLRGAQATGFWLNEIKELPKAVVDMADLRHGRYPSKVSGGIKPTWHGMLGDTNAPDDDHWYYKLAEEERPEGWTFFKQPGGLIRMGKGANTKFIPNPAAENLSNLPDGYYVRGMAGKARDWVCVNLCNLYGSVADGKPVYPEWNDAIHVAPNDLEPIKGIPLELSWDFGLTPACIVSQVTPRGQWRVIDELVSDGVGIRQFANNVVLPYLASEYPGIEIDEDGVGDPAGVKRMDTDERTVFDELEDAGLPAKPASTNNFLPRRESVAGYLTRLIDGEPAFLLSPKAKVLRKGFNGGYRYRRIQVAGEARYKDEPDKNEYSHPHDALQYEGLKLDVHGKNPIAKKKKPAPPPAKPRRY